MSSVPVPRVLDVAVARAGGALAGGTASVDCPACHATIIIETAMVVHDPDGQRFILVIPERLRHRELEERAELLLELAADKSAAPPPWVVDFEVVFGAEGLARALARPQQSLHAREAALAQLADELALREAALLGERQPRVAGRETPPLTEPRGGEPEAAERTHVTRVPGDDRLGQAESGRVLVEDGVVRWRARAGQATLTALAAGRPALTIQTFLELGHPLFVLSLSAGPLPAARPEEVLTACLDLGRADDAAVLAALSARAQVRMTLVDGHDQPMRMLEVDAPLEDNVQLGLRLAAERLAAGGTGSFEAAMIAYAAPGSDRLGKRAASLAADSFGQVQTPAEILLALEVVAHWSSPQEERYLLCERALPAQWWRTCRRHVLERAVVTGLALPQVLADIAVGEGLARNRRDLVGRLLRGFTASCEADIVLEAAGKTSNWRALAAEALAEGVTLGGRTAELAAAALGTSPRSAAARPSPAGPLAALAEDELLALLDDRAGRGEAAIALARRGGADTICPVFRAIRRMTRGDAVRVLPELTAYGAAAVPALIEALSSKKGFVRHGAGLALAVLAHPAGREPLCAQLVAEPTEMWRELARGVGALGPAVLASLAGRVREVALDRHERLAWAMAHVAAHDGHSQVEALARGRDRLVADVARTALELVAAARKSDAEVRGRAPAPETTVNRAFSRSFFDAIAVREGDGAPAATPRAPTLRLKRGSQSGAGARPQGEAADDEEILDEGDLLPG
jgi:hypothetical protein